MHVAGLLVFDPTARPGGPVTLPELHHLVGSRLRSLPRFRQRVRLDELGSAHWLATPRVSLGAHMRFHQLPAPGHRGQLMALCARIHERGLARDRPLWEMHLIDGLSAGRQALLIKMHHAITDGIAGVEVAEVLFDHTPATGRSNGAALQTVLPTNGGPMLHSLQGLLGVAFTLAGGPVALKGPFNSPVGAHRSLAIAALPMDEIRAAKQELGGSVDDVLLAVIAVGLRRYFAQEGVAGAPAVMRAMVPVSTRSATGKPRFGNHVTSVFVDLPLDAPDMRSCIERIAASKAVIRSAHEGPGLAMMIEVAGALPPLLHRTVVRLVGALPVANLVISDVPGPSEAQSILGAPIEACYPMLPLPPSVGVSIAAISMGGVMGLGLVVDPDQVPHPQRLADAVRRALHSAADRPKVPTGSG
jgi:diacylglycerol O-acyltransferase